MWNRKDFSHIFLKNMDFCFYRNNKKYRGEITATSRKKSIVFYDQACPLCRKEIHRLKLRDHRDRLFLLDINSMRFSEQDWGISHESATQTLHVLTEERIWLVGMPAIRHVYAQVGQGWIMAPSAWPLVSRLADVVYRYIAPNRYQISNWIGLDRINKSCNDVMCKNK